MADASAETYSVEGHQISIKVLKDFSGILPHEALAIVKRTQEVIAALRVGAISIMLGLLPHPKPGPPQQS